MSRLRPALLVLALAAAGLIATSAPAAADDASDAAKVAGLLRSSDPAERLQGESLLLARLRAGGDLPAFLRALADALASPGAAPRIDPVTATIYDVRDLVDAGLPADRLSWRLMALAPQAEIVVRGTTLEVRAGASDHGAIAKALEAIRKERTPVLPVELPAPPAPSPTGADGPHLSVLARVYPMKAEEAASLLGEARDRIRLLDEAAAGEMEGRLASRPDPWTVTLSAPLGSEAWTYQSKSVVSYRKDVTRTASGGWSPVTGEIPEGRRLALTPVLADGRVRMPIRLSDTTVSRPIPTTTVKPAPDAAPVEIDAPQWTSVAAAADLDLPGPSGTALVHLPGLDVVVLLRYRVEPAAPAR